MRSSTERRITNKEISQKQLIQQVQALWIQVEDSLGGYNKIITFLATERKSIFESFLNTSSNQINSNLDLVEKYYILRDLHDQILALSRSSPVVKTKREAYNFVPNTIMQNTYLNPRKPIKESLIPSQGFSLSLLNMQQKTQQPAINNSFDQLKLEDEIDELYLKWSKCSDILD